MFISAQSCRAGRKSPSKPSRWAYTPRYSSNFRPRQSSGTREPNSYSTLPRYEDTTQYGSPWTTQTSFREAASSSSPSSLINPTLSTCKMTTLPSSKSWPRFDRCLAKKTYPSQNPSCIPDGALPHGFTTPTPTGLAVSPCEGIRTSAPTTAGCGTREKPQARSSSAICKARTLKAGRSARPSLVA